MGNRREGVDELKALGNQHTKYVFDYNPDVLEKIPNKHADRDNFVKFNCSVRFQKSWGLSRGLCQYYHDRLD